MHARLLALASLVMAPVALAAGNISQFPKKLGAPVEGSAVVVAEPTGAQGVFAAAGNKLHGFGLDGKPLPGFPLVLGPDEAVVGDIAAADMDGDGRAEVAIATKGGKLFLVSKGAVAAGFPVALATGCAAGPSFGDLDGDNKPELLQGDRSGVLHVLKATGAALAPFPLALGEALTSSPSVGKLDGQVVVAVGSEKGKVYVVDSRGVMPSGFPLVTHFTVSGAPAFGDLDDDGKVDLVVASADFNLYAVSGTGEPLAGFPFTTQLALTGAPALADLDGDDVLDAVFTSTDGQLYAVGQGGKPLPGFPVKFESALPGGVAVGDLDRDGKPDLMVGTRDGKVHVVTAAGKKLPGSPQKVGSNPATPFLARLKDGSAVAFVGGADGELAGLRFDLKASGPPAAIAWAGAAHGASRSGRYFPNPLRYKDLAITPSPSRVEDTLKATWTYFSIDGVAEPAPPIGWLRNGQRVKELDGKREVPPRTVKKGEKWRFELQVGQRVVKGPEVVIQDTPPTAPQVRVVPGSLSVKSSAKLEVVTPSQDADGDKVTYKINWLLDGQNTNLTGEQLPAARLKKNQRWTAVVVPFDGELDGPVAATDATVANAPPGAPKLAMEPKAPRKGQVIAPVLQQAGPDPDGDAVQHRYRWTVNGVAANFPLGQATLPVQSLKKGDTVALEVTAYDGKAEGDPWKGELKVVNTPPPAPKVAIVPAEPRAGQALRALVLAPSQDADADVVGYRAAWTRNGAPFAPAGDAFEVPAPEVKKGDKWAVTLTPNDGEADGAQGSANTTIRNTPPSLPLVKLEPEHPTTGGGITLVVVQPSKDVDGDKVTTNAVWTRDGKPVEDARGAPRGQRAALAVNEFKKHEKVRVAMTPSDGAVEGQTGFYEVTIDNAVPGAPVVALEPAVPNNQAPLRAVIRTAAPDTDGDTIQYRYTWLKNGTPQAFPEAQAEVPAKELKKGDHWVVLVRAWDGEVLGPTARAATQIGNAPPPAPKVAIAPEAPRRGQELRALLTEAVDPDGEVLAYRYAWKRNGQAVQVGPQAAQVPHDLPRKGDAWSVEVIASDGQADSPVARAEVKVVNTVPTAPRLVLEPARPTTGGGITLKVTEASTDADGDPVKYSFAWTRDGAAVTGGEGKARQALTAKEFKKHEKVRVVATPNDGVADGPVAVAEVEVDDALPTAPVVAIEPATPTNQAPMKAVIRTPATDTDGDTLVYRYTWLRNGLRQAFPDSQAEVPASELKKGDRWTLVVRAWDGEALGPEAGASAQVGNATPPAPKVAIAPGTPRRGEELRALLTEAVDPDADPLAYRYEWRRNGQPIPLEPKAAAVPREQPRKGDVWTVDVIANDGLADSKPAHAETKIANTAPGLPVISLCQGPVPAGAPLEVKVLTPSTDADADPVAYKYEWTVNGQAQGKWTGRTTLGAGDTKKHDKLRVTVTPNDGTENGAAATADCEVEDTPPGAPVASLEPAVPSAESGLEVLVPKAPEDRDGDRVSYQYAWLKNGLPFEVGGDGSAVKPGTLKRSDELRVVVASYDGERTGGQTALSATVKNTPPPAPVVTVAPAQPVTGEKLSCTAQAPATDVDGDPVRVHYQWLRNGKATPLSEDSPELPAGTVKKAETWRCEAWADDGYALSARAGADVTVKNSPPPAPKVAIEPETAGTGSELTCRVAQEALDPDGDPVTYLYAWRRNGKAEVELANPAVVPPERTKKGDGWQCSVTATDGAQEGAAAVAETAITNSPPGAARVHLGPRDPVAGQSLRCELVDKAVDPDGDKLEHRFFWFKDGVQQNFAPTSLEVPGRLVKAKELWSCEVQAFDGKVEGPRTSSGAVAVRPQQP